MGFCGHYLLEVGVALVLFEGVTGQGLQHERLVGAVGLVVVAVFALDSHFATLSFEVLSQLSQSHLVQALRITKARYLHPWTFVKVLSKLICFVNFAF